MIFPLFRHRQPPATISILYGMIVAQARLPVFYRDYGVPDTVDGRFELVLLHLFLVMRRLDDLAGHELGQQIFDLFCRDMDRNLREMGVGDLKVPKEMRRIGEAYYGRAAAYKAALASTDPAALENAVGRNVFSAGVASPRVIAGLAAYIRKAAGRLDGQDVAAFHRGELRFPEPEQTGHGVA